MSRALLMVLAVLCLSGCGLFQRTKPNSGTAAEVGKILNEVKTSVDEVKTGQAALVEAETKRQESLTQRDQFISNHVNAAHLINDQNPVPNEHTEIVGKELEPTLPLLPTPTPESQAKAIANLKLALEKTEAARRELELNYELEKRRSAELKTEADTAREAVMARQAELNQATSKLDEQVGVLANKEAEVRVAAAEAERQARIAREEAASKTRLKVAYIFMGLGGLLIAAAVVATILRVPGVLQGGLAGGGVLGFIGWMITYVEDLLQQMWFRFTAGAVLVVVIGLIGWMTWRALKTRKKSIADEQISQGAVGAIEELKNRDREGYEKTLRPHLQEWFVTDDGQPDHNLHKEIDHRLITMNLRNPKPQTPASK